MTPTTAKALFLGVLALALLATPTASADDRADRSEAQCEIVETMLFPPYVVVHPECIPDPIPTPWKPGEIGEV